MRSRPPQVIERADPGAAVEIMRLRDRTIATEEQARRAQRAAAEAREAVGRESAINQASACGHRTYLIYVRSAKLFEHNRARFEGGSEDYGSNAVRFRRTIR